MPNAELKDKLFLTMNEFDLGLNEVGMFDVPTDVAITVAASIYLACTLCISGIRAMKDGNKARLMTWLKGGVATTIIMIWLHSGGSELAWAVYIAEYLPEFLGATLVLLTLAITLCFLLLCLTRVFYPLKACFQRHPAPAKVAVE